MTDPIADAVDELRPYDVDAVVAEGRAGRLVGIVVRSQTRANEVLAEVAAAGGDDVTRVQKQLGYRRVYFGPEGMVFIRLASEASMFADHPLAFDAR